MGYRLHVRSINRIEYGSGHFTAGTTDEVIRSFVTTLVMTSTAPTMNPLSRYPKEISLTGYRR